MSNLQDFLNTAINKGCFRLSINKWKEFAKQYEKTSGNILRKEIYNIGYETELSDEIVIFTPLPTPPITQNNISKQ